MSKRSLRSAAKRIRHGASLLIAAIVVIATVLIPALPAAAATVTFTPGAAWNDQNGKPLQMHGLGIVKVGATWYAFGEDKTGESATNTSFQDIPCYTSTDLRNWTYQSVALAKQAGGDLGPNRIVERPKVIYNASTSTYVMYVHLDNSSYTDRRVGIATSPTPCGPYTYRGGISPLGNQSRDIGLFQDTDGSAYLMSEDPNAGLRIDRLSADYLSVSSSVALFQDLEAPAIVKAGGRYYLLASHLTGWGTNDNVYASATSLSGPWTGFNDVAQPGTNTYNSQTANIITVQGTAGTTYIYAGDRWTTNDLGTSPLIWLPLTLSGTTASITWYNSWTLDAAAGTWSPGGSGGSEPADGSTHYLTAANSGLVMDVNGASTASGAKIIQWSNHGGTNQQWTVHLVSGNVFTLVNVNSGKCLEAPNQSTAQGTQLDQSTCNGATSQQWSVNPVVNGSSGSSYNLVNVNSGLYADVFGASGSAGTAIDQWPGNGGTNQVWNFS